MTEPTVAPYGSWPSPISAEILVEQAVRLSYLTVRADRLYWIESRPSEGGREALVSAPLDGGEPADVLPPDFSVRTMVHEYGGRCFDVGHNVLVFSNWSDQRLWVSRAGGPPEPLSEEPASPRSLRFADPVISPDGAWVACVREAHSVDGRVVNDLVAFGLDDSGSGPRVIASGHDFYSSPRLSADGSRLAWLTWDQPDMPWDATELWVAGFPDPGSPVKVAGGPGESVTQPRWSPSGVLHYVSDRTGWWNLYDESGRALCPMDAEFAEPDWTFGNTSYGFTPDGDLVATWSSSGRRHLGRVRDGRAVPEDVALTYFSSIQPVQDGVFAIAGSPTENPAVVRIAGGEVEVRRRSRDATIDPAHLSVPEPIEFPTGGGDLAHAYLYLPVHADYRGLDGERPPVVVIIHGGPTGSASPVLNLSVQYWTTRGFAVADVDYRGSAGYGRQYRRKLERRWGIADVEDCASVVSWLDGQGLVDGGRAVIRGGSAGGFTTLAALAFTERFAAGASHYGVADLELLARDTHKFEARYLDGLIGPWPEDSAVYQERSPIHHVGSITSPLILFQGLEDMVVPADQAQIMFEALRDRGVPVAYLAFAGEQHGFRRAETVVSVMQAELEFYGRVLGFSPSGPEVALPIENEDRLPARA